MGSDISSRTMLVTGAGGFVGAAVARAAHAAGVNVHATGRAVSPDRLSGSGIRYHPLDLDDDTTVDALLLVTRPDIVVHTAWAGVSGAARASDVQSANITATCRLADAAIRSGARKFVGVGSQAEYGPLDGPVAETHVPMPSTLYGAAKLSACHLARQRCEAAGVDFAWLRLFATYGPGDNPNWLIPSLIAQMAAGVAPKMTPGTQKWDYLYNDDTAAGILATATSDARGIFNLASGGSARVRDIAAMIRDRVAPGLELNFGEVPFGPTQIMHMEGDIAALRSATGWSPKVGLAEGLDRTVAAYSSSEARKAVA
ncbi:NAD(P)-dependent oxidoreductase [Sphingomonas sp. JC676]|uniref:NAD-dependent epimerase/dehydratase family protein n=1 Tax=Sphingomonas sp. JC676 TaxID=2768065 RepID=UPI001657939A|nr:NAD(P)-dependent oxidoreductase [Sphingomonas sp. JC676]MBC9034089.1 NAD(P)-dependent oxidoreductase [Sphingomonas sp. JC676]